MTLDNDQYQRNQVFDIRCVDSFSVTDEQDALLHNCGFLSHLEFFFVKLFWQVFKGNP